MNKKTFWMDALERAVKTAAQTAAALMTAEGFGLLTADWPAFGSAVAGAFALSIVTSIASGNVGDPRSASVLD